MLATFLAFEIGGDARGAATAVQKPMGDHPLGSCYRYGATLKKANRTEKAVNISMGGVRLY